MILGWAGDKNSISEPGTECTNIIKTIFLLEKFGGHRFCASVEVMPKYARASITIHIVPGIENWKRRAQIPRNDGM